MPGIDVDLESGQNICYYGVFRSMVPNSVTMYVGNVFLDDKYVVWDQTPKTTRKEDYIQIGIGQADPNAIIGEI